MPDSLASITKKVASSLAPSDREIVSAILYSPGHSASAVQLKALLGLKSIVQANAAIGRLGKKIFGELGEHPAGLETGTFQWWSVAALGSASESVGFVWSLREEVVSGLIAAGYPVAGAALPEEIDSTKLVEGAFRQIAVNAYERNPVARQRCLAAYGTACVVCGFDFGKVYGSDAEGFIHVHHIIPISSIGSSYEVDPIKDLRPVCPNCHAFIHMFDPPKTIEQARLVVSNNGT
jgi:predicted HNH restriction endonuclease